jgi:NAD/NADP transhydrogenase beta subunit
MRNQWQDFLELIWSSRYDPIASRKYRIALLEILLAVVIAVAAGPAIFAAMEMTALMELLGGVLFLTAMGAGARLVALNIWNGIYRLTFPVPLAAIVRPSASMPLKALASTYVAAIALWGLVLALDCRYMGSLNYSEYVHE